MDTSALKAYTKLTAFLGHALGPDYEISLFNYVNREFVIVAIANIGVSGRKLGDTLSEEELRISSEGRLKDSSYIVHYKNRSTSGKVLRASTLFIKDEEEQLTGLLCINFDDSHYTELSDRILELCHPHAFVETNFSYNSGYMEESTAGDDPLLTSISLKKECLDEIVEELLQKQDLNRETLGVKEKLLLVKQLEEIGVFDRKGAVSQAAKLLNCSLATMYRYLAQIKK